MSISDDQLSTLSSLDSKKSKFIILVKWRYPFHTRLENLRKPDDYALVGIIAEQIRQDLFEGFEQFFDLLADYANVNEAYNDSGSIEVPAIDQIIGQLTTVVAPSKIRLLECEEVMIDVLCQVRKKYSIFGAKPGDLDHLRNKAIMKQMCKTTGVPTTRFIIIDFQQSKSTDELIEELEQAIGGYPMFKKPVKGFGSGGTGTIENQDKLRHWLDEMSGKAVVYLIEECLHKREFWATAILLQNGTWKPLYIINCGNLTIRQMLDKQLPIPFFGKKFEDYTDEFPGLYEFVDIVIKKLKPPAPHCFCVQGFQLESGTNQYLFTECGYRLNGPRGCSLSYKACGISQETAFLEAYMNSKYEPLFDPTLYVYYVWYPYKAGTLQSHTELPADAPVESRVKFNWRVPVGSRLFNAINYNHFLVFVVLEHENEQVAKRDLQYFLDVWRPNIV